MILVCLLIIICLLFIICLQFHYLFTIHYLFAFHNLFRFQPPPTIREVSSHQHNNNGRLQDLDLPNRVANWSQCDSEKRHEMCQFVHKNASFHKKPEKPMWITLCVNIMNCSMRDIILQQPFTLIYRCFRPFFCFWIVLVYFERMIIYFSLWRW